MIHKDLHFQLQGLLNIGLTEDSTEYQRVKAILEEVSKHTKKDWNKKSTIEAVRAVEEAQSPAE